MKKEEGGDKDLSDNPRSVLDDFIDPFAVTNGLIALLVSEHSLALKLVSRLVVADCQEKKRKNEKRKNEEKKKKRFSHQRHEMIMIIIMIIHRLRMKQDMKQRRMGTLPPTSK